jgi:hypothetical protein
MEQITSGSSTRRRVGWSFVSTGRNLSGLFVAVSALSTLSASDLALARGSSERRGAVESVIVPYGSNGRLPLVADRVLEAEINAFSRRFQFRLLPSPIVDPSFTESFVTDDTGTHRVPTHNHSFKGKLVDDPESTVRLTLVGRAMKGVVRTGSEMFFIEPLSASSENAEDNEILVYRAVDNPPPELPVDDVVEADSEAAPSEELGVFELAGETLTAAQYGFEFKGEAKIVYDNDDEVPTDTFVRRIDLGVLADYRFYSVNHANDEAETYADMEAAVNAVDAIYRDTIRATLRITRLDILKTVGAETNTKIPHCPDGLHANKCASSQSGHCLPHK